MFYPNPLPTPLDRLCSSKSSIQTSPAWKRREVKHTVSSFTTEGWVRGKGRNRNTATLIGWRFNQNNCFQPCLNLSSYVICTLAWIPDWRGNPWWMANYWLQNSFAKRCICCGFVNVSWFLSAGAARANFSNEPSPLIPQLLCYSMFLLCPGQSKNKTYPWRLCGYIPIFHTVTWEMEGF